MVRYGRALYELELLWTVRKAHYRLWHDHDLSACLYVSVCLSLSVLLPIYIDIIIIIIPNVCCGFSSLTLLVNCVCVSVPFFELSHHHYGHQLTDFCEIQYGQFAIAAQIDFLANF